MLFQNIFCYNPLQITPSGRKRRLEYHRSKKTTGTPVQIAPTDSMPDDQSHSQTASDATQSGEENIEIAEPIAAAAAAYDSDSDLYSSGDEGYLSYDEQDYQTNIEMLTKFRNEL